MKKNRRSVLIMIAAIGLVAACSSAPEPATVVVPDLRWEQVDTADGATLYANLCASCHGPEGVGNGPVAEILSVSVPDLTVLARDAGGRFPLKRVEDAIRGPATLEIHGGPQMPLWGPALEGVFDDLPRVNREGFAANRIRKLARHLESIQVD